MERTWKLAGLILGYYYASATKDLDRAENSIREAARLVGTFGAQWDYLKATVHLTAAYFFAFGRRDAVTARFAFAQAKQVEKPAEVLQILAQCVISWVEGDQQSVDALSRQVEELVRSRNPLLNDLQKRLFKELHQLRTVPISYLRNEEAGLTTEEFLNAHSN